MAYSGAVARWDAFSADLEPGVGREQKGKRRPVSVVSNDGFNAAFPVVTIVSVSKAEAKKRQPYPFAVLIPAGTITPLSASNVTPHQVRTVSNCSCSNRSADSRVKTFT